MASSVRGDIEEFCLSQGYELGVNTGPGKAYGLPTGVVFLKPNYCPVDGQHTIMVTPINVVSLTKTIPFNNNVLEAGSSGWLEYAKWPYSNKSELASILIKAHRGCW